MVAPSPLDTKAIQGFDEARSLKASAVLIPWPSDFGTFCESLWRIDPAMRESCVVAEINGGDFFTLLS